MTGFFPQNYYNNVVYTTSTSSGGYTPNTSSTGTGAVPLPSSPTSAGSNLGSFVYNTNYNVNYSINTNVSVGEYSLSYNHETNTLYVKDPDGAECLAIRQKTLMLGDKSIYEVIYEMVQMILGKENVLAWLTDDNIHKRAIAELIHTNK